ncbi:MAG: flippase-like domain-containing protein, partial [Bdellovibrionales bacterium]|nr:flippase-like domain-containing protein [Bdellovibrionales bacterium]
GGDVARSYHLGKRLKSQRDAFVSTFLERFTGLLAMSLLGVGAVLLGSDVAQGVELAVLLVGVVVLMLAAIVFSKRCGDVAFAVGVRVLRFVSRSAADRIERLLEKISLAAAFARNNPRLLFHSLLLSFAFHAAGVLNTWIAARAVGWEDPSFQALFVVVPLVLLVGMIPLTPSGLGLTEGAFLFFLQRIGATEPVALGVGLLLRAKVIVVALIGGLLYLTLRGHDDRSLVSPPEDAPEVPLPADGKPVNTSRQAVS